LAVKNSRAGPVPGLVDQPRRQEIVLHHRDPAVVAAGLVARLLARAALLDRLEVDLVVVRALGVDPRAGEGEVQARAAGRIVAVADELQVQARVDRRVRRVDDLVLHADDVVAASEGVGLDQLDAADRIALERHLQLVLAAAERALARQNVHRRVMVRQAGTPGGGTSPVSAR
jgi:hypothetical protein